MKCEEVSEACGAIGGGTRQISLSARKVFISSAPYSFSSSRVRIEAEECNLPLITSAISPLGSSILSPITFIADLIASLSI